MIIDRKKYLSLSFISITVFLPTSCITKETPTPQLKPSHTKVEKKSDANVLMTTEISLLLKEIRNNRENKHSRKLSPIDSQSRPDKNF